MKITQVELIFQQTPATYLKTICWLPSEHNWKKDMRVSLKENPSIIWTISEVFSTQEHYELNRKWDVGGL